VSQLALSYCWLTRLTWFRDKRQRGRGGRTAQAAGPLAADRGYRDTETKQKNVSQRVRRDSLGDPGAARGLADDPPSAMPVQPAPVRSQEDRSISSFNDGQVDRPGSPRGASGMVMTLPP